MKRISAIEAQKKNPQRVNIYLDGEYAFGLSCIVAAWLKVGQELSDDKIANMQTEDEREILFQKAMHFLSYRPRSSQEVRRYFIKHNVDEPLIEATLARLQQNGMVNDENFVRMWIENRNEFHPRSHSALAFELRWKGLDEQVIETILEETLDDEILALRAAQKYATRLNDLEWSEFRKKLVGFLARRGFSYSIINPLISEIWEDKQQTEGCGINY